VPSSEDEAGPVLAVLYVRSGVGGGDRFVVGAATARLGRSPDNDVVLVAPSVSPNHAELRLRGGLWSLRELGSAAGSLVDGVAVGEGTLLAPGSEIQLGEVRLVFDPRDGWEDSPVEMAAGAVAEAPPAGSPESAAATGRAPVRDLQFHEASTQFVILPESESDSRRAWFVAAVVVAVVAAFLYFFLKAG
jgi:predicted component of type VI protein secretion system